MRVVLERLDPKLLGRDEKPQPSWLRAISQLWKNSRLPEVRATVGSGVRGRRSRTCAKRMASPRVFVQDVPRLLEHTGTVQLSEGEIFGELAAMSRTPRTATVVADGPATLLEIRWQGLRDIMRRTPAIREHVEQLYRVNSLRVHLRETELLDAICRPTQLDRVAAATEFESFGNFDWYTDFGPTTSDATRPSKSRRSRSSPRREIGRPGCI